MTKKYELIKLNPRDKYFTIKALRDIHLLLPGKRTLIRKKGSSKRIYVYPPTKHTVFEGDIGGQVENENNLNQYGNCWIFSGNLVKDSSHVSGNAILISSGHGKENIIVEGNSKIYDNAILSEGSLNISESIISGLTRIYGWPLLNDSHLNLISESKVRYNITIENMKITKNTIIKLLSNETYYHFKGPYTLKKFGKITIDTTLRPESEEVIFSSVDDIENYFLFKRMLRK